MAYTTNTFAVDKARMRWFETYTTEGLNVKATAESHGVVRGFEIAAQSPLSTSQFRLLVDPAKGDSVAVIRDANNRCVTVVLDSDVTVDLVAAGVVPAEYWICLFYQYVTGGPQDAPKIVLLTSSELTAAPYVGNILVLGWVQYLGAVNIDPNPAAGTPNLGVTDYILAITETPPPAIREIARNYESKGRCRWRNALRGGRADEDATHQYSATMDWKRVYTDDVDALSTALSIQDTDPDEGLYHFRVRMATTGANPIAQWIQKNATPVRGGDLVRLSMKYKVPAATPGAYFINFGVQFVDKLGNILAQPSAVVVYDAAGAATSWERAEYMVHVIEGRDVAYMLPTLQIAFADPGPPNSVDFYLDDLCVEVLSSDGPQLQSVPDGVDSMGQIIRSSTEHIFGPDFTGGPPPTDVDPTVWAKYVENDGTLKFIRLLAAASAKGPVVGIQGTGALMGAGPVGPTLNARRGLYIPNTPRAWATLRWVAAATNFTIQASFGFNVAAGVVRTAAGVYELTFDTDEDSNKWVLDDKYAVQFGMRHPAATVGPTAFIFTPSVRRKIAGPPAVLEIVMWAFIAGAVPGPPWLEADPNVDDVEIMLSVFADD